MKTFSYKGYDAAGKSRRGLIEALDLKQAREQLAATGVLAEQVTPAGEAGAGRWRTRRASFGMGQRALVYQELVALLRAGVPLVQAFELLIRAPELRPWQVPLADARDRLREGAPLADALAAAIDASSACERAVIAAGERAAILDVALERLALFLEEQVRVRDKIVTALIYPVLIIVVAVLIAVGLLGFAVPHLAQLIAEEGLKTRLPLLTRIMLSLGQVLAWTGIPLAVAGALGVTAIRHRLRTSPEWRLAWDRRLFGLPLFGRGYALLVNLRFARTLALLLRGGVQLVDGLRLAGAATGSPWIESLAAQEAESVRHGSSLAEALRRVPLLADTLSGWVQVGESTGTLDRVLDSAGDRLQQRWERYLTRVVALIEPALILAIGVFVLLVVLAIILPILQLNQLLK